eukprot:4507307-Prymnesium_polylepis.1
MGSAPRRLPHLHRLVSCHLSHEGDGAKGVARLGEQPRALVELVQEQPLLGRRVRQQLLGALA